METEFLFDTQYASGCIESFDDPGDYIDPIAGRRRVACL